MCLVQIVPIDDPAAIADDASALLQSAWNPPCLAYGADHLRWRWSIPSTLPPVVVAAYENDIMLACVAAVGRRVRIGDVEIDAYSSSFFAARPGSPGFAAAMVMRTEGRQIVGRNYAVTSFAQPGTAGDDMLQLKLNRISHVAFGPAHVHAAVAKPDAPMARAVGPTEWLATWDALPLPDRTLTPVMTPELCAYELADPDGRELVVVDGQAAAIVGVVRMVNAKHEIEHLPNIPLLRATTPEGLRGIIAYAARRGNPVVTIPNVRHLDPTLLRKAGVRAIPSTFAAYASAADPNHPTLQATNTACEVV